MPDDPNQKSGDRGIFPTFFMAGFECSTFVWKDGKRRDYVGLTGHDRHLRQDYRRAMELGLGVVREAIRWPMVEKGTGRYHWDEVIPVFEAANEARITAIWDLCHYGFPDGCDPFSEDCLLRFKEYCRAAAVQVVAHRQAPRFFTPVNEITFYSGAGTDMGWMYPFAKGRFEEFQHRLCQMAIEGAKAIREVDPQARMVNVDPIIYEIPDEQDPKLAEQAWEDTYVKAYRSWDTLAGRLNPELGGSPEILDIVGVNVYSYCEAALKVDNTREPLSPGDPRRKPLSQMLKFAHDRYKRPIIIGETSGYQDKRAEWLHMVMEESLKALNMGVDLQGICLFPCVDMPDWEKGEWAKIGIYDIEDRQSFERIPCDPYIQELRNWQHVLNRPKSHDDASQGADRVDLEQVRRYAREWEKTASIGSS